MINKILKYGRYRLEEILMLMGIPLLGIAFSQTALSLPRLLEAGIFLVATFFVLFHAYSFNDWAHYKLDAVDPNKKEQDLLTRLISLNEILAFSIVAFILGMGAYALLFPRVTMVLCLAIILLWILYSNQFTLLKSVPVLSTGLHLIAGTLFFTMGWSLFQSLSGESWAGGLFFGLLYASGHLSHETIDYEGDCRAGLRTNAVLFGRRNTFWANFAGMTLSTVYVCLLSALGVVYSTSSAAVFTLAYLIYCFLFRQAWKGGLSYSCLNRFRSRYRKIYSLAGGAVILILILSS